MYSVYPPCHDFYLGGDGAICQCITSAEVQAAHAHLSSAAVAPGVAMLLLGAGTTQKLKLLAFFIVVAAQQSCLGNSESECCDRLMVFS